MTLVQAFADGAAIITAILITLSINVFALACAHFVTEDTVAHAIIVTPLIGPGVVASLLTSFAVDTTFDLTVASKVTVVRVGVGIGVVALAGLLGLAGTLLVFLVLAAIRVVLGAPGVTLFLALLGCLFLEVDDLIFVEIGGEELGELDIDVANLLLLNPNL